MTNATQCPSRDELSNFCAGELPAESFDAIAVHLESCPACEAELGELEAVGVAALAPLREPLVDTGFLAEPQLERARGRLEAMLWQPGAEAAHPFAGQAECDSPASSPSPTLQLRDYRLVGILGQGGMGTVYKALHTRLNRVVAVKVLPEDRTRDAQAVARFQREMKAVGALKHPNIVAAHDAGEADGRHFLAMEYVEGLNLSELVRRMTGNRVQGTGNREHGGGSVGNALRGVPSDGGEGSQNLPLPPGEGRGEGTPMNNGASVADDQENSTSNRPHPSPLPEGEGTKLPLRRPSHIKIADACELVRQAALGLEYAHQHTLVHRDIKPSNLMLTAEGQVKILDMGLARLHGDTAVGGELTDSSQIMGTIDYMAPEQADDSHTVDGRADIYSLGCTLYKLLVGVAPFGGNRYKSPAQKLLAHTQAPPPSLVERRGDVPAELASAVERMLAKSPSERYATMAELARVLAQFTAGSDLQALYAAATDNELREAFAPSAAQTSDAVCCDTPRSRIRKNSGDPQAREALSRSAASAVTETLALPSSETPDRRRRLLIALAGAGAVLLGVVIVIKMRDGTSTTIKADGEVEQIVITPQEPAEARPANRDRAVAEWVLTMGGKVAVAQNGEVRLVQRAAELPPKAFRISSVDLRDVETLADDDLVRLQGLTEIQMLNLWGTNIGDTGLAHLAGLKSLRHLILRSTRVTEASFKIIAGLTNLEGLGIDYIAFSDDGLRQLTTLKQLKYLQAPTTLTVGDDGLLELRHLTHLQHLSINAADATPKGLAFVEGLPELEVLDLLTTPVDDAGLKHLGRTTRLKWLRFTDAGITVEGWRALLPAARLRGLHVMGRELADPTLEGIAQLTDLDDLTVSGFAAGDDGLKPLARMANLKRLFLEPCEQITDAGLVHLEALSQLKELTLVGSKVTAAGVERLQQAIPECKITH